MATILIVDDRAVNRHFLGTLLGYGGHRLLEAADGVDALKMARAEHPDLVITDVLMPTMDGSEFARQVHADPTIAETPIIFYTATYRREEVEALARSCGVSTVLQKPSEPQVILDAVNTRLGIRQLAPLPNSPVLHQYDGLTKVGLAPSRFPEPLSQLDGVNLRITKTVERGLELIGQRKSLQDTASELKRQLMGLQKDSLQLSSLIELGQELAAERDPLYLLETACRGAQQILSAKYATIGVLDEAGQSIKHFFVRGMTDEAKLVLGTLQPRTGILGEALERGCPRRVCGLNGDPTKAGLPAAHPPIDSLLAVPIVVSGRTHGWLYLGDKLGAKEFSADDERFAMTVVAQLAKAQENIMLYHEIRLQNVALEREIGERKKAEQHLTIQHATASALADYGTLEEAVPRILQAVCETLDWQMGELWMRDESADVLRCTTIWHAAEVDAKRFANMSRKMTFPRGIGLAGRVWATKQPIWTMELDDSSCRRAPWAKKIGLLIGSGFPIVIEGQVTGVVVLRSNEHREPSEDLIKTFAACGNQIGAFIERKRIQQTAEQFRRQRELILESVGEGIYGIDRNGTIIFENPAAARMLGYRPEELTGKLAHRTMHHSKPDSSPHPVEECPIYATLRDGGVHQVDDEVFWRRDGTSFPVWYTATPMHDERGEIAGAVVAFRDVTERVRAQAALSAAEERLRGIVASIDNVVWSVSVPELEVLYMSPVAEKVYGVPVADFYENKDLWFDMILPEEQASVTQGMSRLYEAGAYTFRYRIRRSDGALRWLEARATLVCNQDGDPVRIDGVMSDISEQKHYEAHIERLANHDVLTDLPNRNLLKDRLLQAMAHARRKEQLLGVLFLDLDRFNEVNVSFGHALGDLLLKAVGSRLQELIRDGDTLARQGGDEFIIMLTDLQTPEDVTKTVSKILKAFALPFLVDGHELYVTASIGASLYPIDGNDVDALLRNADTAMYRAKDGGNNGFRFYSANMSIRAMERLELENDLRRALDCRQFSVVYQPKVDLLSGAIIGAEALIRWHHPEKGVISPARFIPTAEQTGLIIPIGEWVLRTACEQNKAWQNEGLPPICVSVNVSVRQLRQDGLAQAIINTLKETRLNAQYLELEVTESLMMEGPDLVIAKLQELKAIGVHLSLDDFGTGYSSLSYLKRFPLDRLKIDQSFVRDIVMDPEDAAITRSVISLGHSLNLKVIAEGVETEEQLAFLRAHHCDEIQGYYFGKPMPAEEFASMLRQDHRLERRNSPDEINACQVR